MVEPPASAPAQAAQAPAVVTPPAPQPSTPPAQADPIADLARQASQRVETAQAPSTAPSPTAASGEWAVQVGSFGEAGNAERLQARLREEGFSAYSRRRDNNMTTVYVGPYASSEAGERAMTELKERANLQGLLVRVRE
ncbi:SPOR domain-containing protein [Halomonas sp. E19]|uniref:SPOR domain-containing protein n=1 Tax=Halomonas sp. E19 TaxID=3397247 RepID=UPI0040345857